MKNYDVPTEATKQQVRQKYIKPIYQGEYTPEEIIIQHIDINTDILKTLESELIEYESFEHHSSAIVLTIAHKEFETRQQVETARERLAELLSDAITLGLLERGKNIE